MHEEMRTFSRTVTGADETGEDLIRLASDLASFENSGETSGEVVSNFYAGIDRTNASPAKSLVEE